MYNLIEISKTVDNIKATIIFKESGDKCIQKPSKNYEVCTQLSNIKTIVI